MISHYHFMILYVVNYHTVYHHLKTESQIILQYLNLFSRMLYPFFPIGLPAINQQTHTQGPFFQQIPATTQKILTPFLIHIIFL